MKEKFEKNDYIIDFKTKLCIKLGVSTGWYCDDSGYYDIYAHDVVVYYSDQNKTWRYANDLEKAKYDNLGKPFNILEEDINSKSLVGRYVKSLIDYGKDIVKKGDFLKILSETNGSYTYEKFGTASKPYNKSNWELMPEGFEPNKVTTEPQFIVGKWYKYKDWYIKYNKTTNDNRFEASEEIDYKRKYQKIIHYFGDTNHEKVEVSLEEIQQYLPDGHTDKIKVITNKEALLEEAKRRYPNGTNYISLNSLGQKRELHKNTKITFKHEISDDNKYIWAGSGFIYVAGQWAEIIEESKHTTKKDDFENYYKDPKNWQIGDVLTCINNGNITSNGFTNEAKQQLKEKETYIISGLPNSTRGERVVTLEGVILKLNKLGFNTKRFKFHSRPSNIIKQKEEERKSWKEASLNLYLRTTIPLSTKEHQSNEEPIIIKSKTKNSKIFTINN